MKFEINHEKLEQVIFKYLDNKNFFIYEERDDYYFLENEDTKRVVIRCNKNNMCCYIYYELIDEIVSFFSINYSDVRKILTKYVENTLNVKISYTFVRTIKTTITVKNS